jgi:hypothetical protein
MTNFELLKEECENYWTNNHIDDYEKRSGITEVDPNALIWGMTSYESFLEIILQVKKPKRFIVFGCSIGYQCFYWNKFFPEIPCIGIDIMKSRLDFGKSMINKYLINNVNLVLGDVEKFKIEDGDLIWQNNLLFEDEFVTELNYQLLESFDIEVISYKDIKNYESIFDKSDLTFIDDSKNLKIIKPKIFIAKTSWTPEQSIYYYYRYNDHFQFDVSYILPEFRISEKDLSSFSSMNQSKRFIKSDILKKYYNKFNLKQKFIEIGFNVPETYLYTNSKSDITECLNNHKTYVAKPAHMSESVCINIKSSVNKIVNVEEINTNLNKMLEVSDKGNWRKNPIDVDIYWKDTEPGILVEEYINVIYELKVFVIFGEPVIGDLREGSTEFYRVDFIKKENKYLNWDKEYQMLMEFTKDLKIDFIRVDFLYDGNKLYATECAFMPGTFLPTEVEELLANKLRMPYLRHYYPTLC